MASNTYGTGWSGGASSIGNILNNKDSDRYFALPISTLNTIISNANLGRVNITGLSLSFNVYVECSQTITPKYSVGYSHATGSIGTYLIADSSVFSNSMKGNKNDSVSLNAALSNNSISNSYGSYVVFRVYSTEWGKKSYSVSSVNLTITFDAIPQYTITLYAGTGVSSVSGGGTYYRGDTATISATLAPGYYLEGNDTCFWSEANEQYQNYTFNTKTVSFTVDKNITLYAWMFPNVYYMRYETNGGSTDPNHYSDSVDYDTNYTIRGNEWFTGREVNIYLQEPDKTVFHLSKNKIFTTWVRRDTGEVYNPGKVVRNLTTQHLEAIYLDAQWAQPVFTMPAPEPKEGYDFLGWKYGKDVIYKPGDIFQFSSDTTYTAVMIAQWQKQKIENGYVGNTKATIYIGNTEVKEIYVGNKKVYG